LKKNHHKDKDIIKNKKLDRDNVKLIEEFNTLKYENKKLKERKKIMEMSLEVILGSENFHKMLSSIDNNAIMGRSKNFIKNSKHKRKASGHPPKIPQLADSKSMQQLQTTRNDRKFDPQLFKKLLEEFDKNKQNVMDQNKIMDDIQQKMAILGKEFELKKPMNSDLRIEENINTPTILSSGSQTQRVLYTTPTESLTNFIQTSGRSSEIRAQAKIEAELLSTQRDSQRRDSLPMISEREERKYQ
jgi:hypothetical protein